MFWKKNEDLNSDEYEKLTKRIIELSAKFEELENKFKILGTNYDNLRGNFNRKLSGIKKEDPSEADEETKTINKPILLDINGNFIKS